MIRLLALDLDGTLLNSRMKLSDFTIRELNRLRSQSVKIAILSGRSLPDIRQVTAGLVADYHAALNGSVIFEPESGKILHEIPADLDAVYGILENLLPRDLSWMVFTPQDVTLNFISEVPATRIYQQSLNPGIFKPDKSKTVLSVQILCRNDDECRTLSEAIRSQYGDCLNCAHMGYQMLQLTSCHSDKGQGLKLMAQIENISPDEVLAIGDSEGDLPMLEFARHRAVMKGSHLDDGSLHYPVTERNADEDGAVRFILRYLQDSAQSLHHPEAPRKSFRNGSMPN